MEVTSWEKASNCAAMLLMGRLSCWELDYHIMPTYVTLTKFTDKGIRDIKKSSAKGQEEALKIIDTIGVKILGMYYVMGEWDLIVIISECQSDEVALTGALAASSDGNFRTWTLRAFRQEKFVEIIKKLP